MQALREGAYDLNTSHLNGCDCDVAESRIAAFLEEEKVAPVILNSYMKDLKHYHNKNNTDTTAEISSSASATPSSVGYFSPERKHRKFNY